MHVTCTDFYGKTHIVDHAKLIDRLSAYGVYIIGGKILFIKDPRSNRWELPGGGVETGETIREGLIREFIEETGIVPNGKFTLLREWTEHFYDVVDKQAWRSKRKFYLIKNAAEEENILAHGNGEDSAVAQMIPMNKLETLHIAPSIKEVIILATLNAKGSI